MNEWDAMEDKRAAERERQSESVRTSALLVRVDFAPAQKGGEWLLTLAIGVCLAKQGASPTQWASVDFRNEWILTRASETRTMQ